MWYDLWLCVYFSFFPYAEWILCVYSAVVVFIFVTHINEILNHQPIRSEYHFKFDDKFEIHDDIEVLKRMGLLLGELISS